MSQNQNPLQETMDNLNRQFYRSYGPSDYLLIRLSLLCVIGGNTEAFQNILVDGVEFGGNKLKFDYAASADYAITEASNETKDTYRDYFIRIESHHLKHLAIETLLRLFLGHKGVPLCPWVEISKVTYDFKERVSQTIVDAEPEELQSDIRQIMLGLPRNGDLLTEEQKKRDHSGALAGVLRLFATDWLDEAKSYNATKHGLSAVPGTAAFSIGPQGEELVNIASGDSLDHLVHTKWDKETASRQWSRTTRWITIDYAVTTVILVRFMIQALWSVAKVRYGLAEGFRPLIWPADFSIDELRELRSGPTELTWTMFEEYRH